MISSWHKKAPSSISGCALKLSFFFHIPSSSSERSHPGYFQDSTCRFSFIFFHELLKYVHFWSFLSEMCELLPEFQRAASICPVLRLSSTENAWGIHETGNFTEHVAASSLNCFANIYDVPWEGWEWNHLSASNVGRKCRWEQLHSLGCYCGWDWAVPAGQEVDRLGMYGLEDNHGINRSCFQRASRTQVGSHIKASSMMWTWVSSAQKVLRDLEIPRAPEDEVSSLNEDLNKGKMESPPAPNPWLKLY